MERRYDKTGRFMPLDKPSQAKGRPLLFVDSQLSLAELYLASSMRFTATYKLLNKIEAMPDNPITRGMVKEVSDAISILLSDVNSMLKVRFPEPEEPLQAPSEVE